MNFRKSRNLMWIGFAVGILIMALGLGHENEKVTVGFMATGIIVFAIAAIRVHRNGEKNKRCQKEKRKEKKKTTKI